MAEFNNLLDQQRILQRQDLTSTEKFVAIVILSFRNAETGRCNPPIYSEDVERKTICSLSGYSKQCVIKTISSLERKKVITCKKINARPSEIVFTVDEDYRKHDLPSTTITDTVNNDYCTVNEDYRHGKPGLPKQIKNKELTNKEQINDKEEKESESFSLTPDEEKPRRITKASLTKPSDASDKVFSDWVDFKRKVSKAISQYMIDAIVREAKKAGISTEQAMVWQMESGYQGFKADWYLKDQSQRTQTAQAQKKPEPKKELSPDDFTDKQISFFAYKLSRYQPFGSKYGHGCDSYDTFATKIEGWLRHPRNFLECLPYLKELHLVN